jgi:drug/metabolite transporter (DMT)-like permease
MLVDVHEAMTRRGWLLFCAMSVIWGIPYLLIKVAVEHVEPPVVVFGRTSLAGAVLLIVAARTDALRPALRHWRPVLAFAAVEMGLPWLLLTNAEKRLPSGLTGLLVACVPLFGAVTAYVLGDHAALRPLRLLGIAIGLGGVALLVGGDLRTDAHGIPWLSVAQVMLVCVGYSIGPFIVARRLADVPSIGVVSVSLTAVAIAVAPLAWLARPTHAPPASAWAALLGLAAVCTGLAFVVFFALIAEIGPTRATLITFANPAIAVVLGAIVLDESITLATIGGFVLVITGCWLSTRPHTPVVVANPEGVSSLTDLRRASSAP